MNNYFLLVVIFLALLSLVGVAFGMDHDGQVSEEDEPISGIRNKMLIGDHESYEAK